MKKYSKALSLFLSAAALIVCVGGLPVAALEGEAATTQAGPSTSAPAPSVLMDADPAPQEAAEEGEGSTPDASSADASSSQPASEPSAAGEADGSPAAPPASTGGEDAADAGAPVIGGVAGSAPEVQAAAEAEMPAVAAQGADTDPVPLDEVPYLTLDKYTACSSEDVYATLTRPASGNWSAVLQINGIHNIDVTANNSAVATVSLGAHLQTGENTVKMTVYEGHDIAVFIDKLRSEGREDDQRDLSGKSTTRSLFIQDSITNATLDWSIDANNPQRVSFSASQILHSHSGSSCAGSLTYEWDFGDSNTDITTTGTVAHTYTGGLTGSTVTVTIVGQGNARAGATREITLGAQLAAPKELCNAEPIVLTLRNPNFTAGSWTADYSYTVNGTGTVSGTAGPFTTPVGTKVIDDASDFRQTGTYAFTLNGIDGASLSSPPTVDVRVVDWCGNDMGIKGGVQDPDDATLSHYSMEPALHCRHAAGIITGYRWSINNSTFHGQQVTAPHTEISTGYYAYIDTTRGTKSSTKQIGGSGSVVLTSPPVMRVKAGSICTYETGEVHVTNTNFNGAAWSFTMNGVDYTSTSRTYTHQAPSLAEGTHTFTISKFLGYTTNRATSIQVVPAIQADFTPVVTTGSLDVDFTAVHTIHRPSSGGSECIQVGSHSSGLAYEWVFDNGIAPVNVASKQTSYTYATPGTKQVTLRIYDQHGAVAATITKPITLALTPAPTDYTVTYAAGAPDAEVAGMPAPAQVVLRAGEACVVSSAVPTRAGYDFIGWQTSEAGARIYIAGESFTMPAKNIVLTAQWRIRTLQVTYDYAGARPHAFASVVYGGTAAEPEPPTWNGYTFNGWFLNGAAYDFAAPVTNNITLVASWSPVSAPAKYTVTFDFDDGRPVVQKKVKAGQLVPREADPAREGYQFLRWDYNKKAWDFEKMTMPAKDITLVARWKQAQTPAPVPSSSTPNPGPSSTPRTPPASRPAPDAQPDRPDDAAAGTHAPSAPASSSPAAGGQVQSAPPASSAPESSSVSAPEQELEDDTDDKVGVLPGTSVPLGGFGTQGFWSLLNLIMAVVACVLTIIQVVRLLIARRRSAYEAGANDDDDDDDDSSPASRRAPLTFRVFSMFAGFVTVLLFLILENITLPMSLVNQWTPLILIVFILHIVALALQGIFRLEQKSYREAD